MPTRINIIKIGWDLGGAHIKYCVESQTSNVIWYDIIDFDFLIVLKSDFFIQKSSFSHKNKIV